MNKKANKKQRVNYFASSWFSSSLFSIFCCELTQFLLLLFDVIISNKCHFAFGTARVRNRSQIVCLLFIMLYCRRSGFWCDGVLERSWNYFFCISSHCFFQFFLILPLSIRMNEIGGSRRKKNIDIFVT